MAAGFVSQRALAKELNRRGVPTKLGGKWHRTTVARMFARLGLVTNGRINNGLWHTQAADTRARALAPTIRKLRRAGILTSEDCAAKWLHSTVLRIFPDSEYAAQHQQTAPISPPAMRPAGPPRIKRASRKLSISQRFEDLDNGQTDTDTSGREAAILISDGSREPRTDCAETGPSFPSTAERIVAGKHSTRRWLSAWAGLAFPRRLLGQSRRTGRREATAYSRRAPARRRRTPPDRPCRAACSASREPRPARRR